MLTFHFNDDLAFSNLQITISWKTKQNNKNFAAEKYETKEVKLAL